MKLHRRIGSASRYGGAVIRRINHKIRGQKGDESNCRYISSRGIKKSCDVWTGHKTSPTSVHFNKIAGQRPSAATSVYVKTEHLGQFADRALDDLDGAFVMVSGDCDDELGPRDIPDEVIQRFVENPNLQAWFAQNCNTRHAKIQTMPIGLDFHTLTIRLRHQPWGYFEDPLSQEKILDDTRRKAPKLADRKLTAYCNWHHAINRGDRLACIRQVEPEAIFLDGNNLRRDLSWQNNAGHLFTISPLGNGLDCHRTWEALLLGSVPIVPRSSISQLFEGLPVCIVDDWREVTLEYLQDRKQWALDNEFDFAPLYLQWWKARIRGNGNLPSKKQRYQDFIDTAHQPPG